MLFGIHVLMMYFMFYVLLKNEPRQQEETIETIVLYLIVRERLCI